MEMFSDGVFAIAATLLIIDVSVALFAALALFYAPESSLLQRG